MESKRKAWWFSVVLVIVLGLLYFLREEKPTTYGISGETMGTTYTIKLLQNPQPELKSEIDQLLLEFNSALSTYIPESEISQLNLSDTFRVRSPYLKFMLEQGRRIGRLTGGAFDPTVMPLVNLWGFGFKNIDRVDSAEVLHVLRNVGVEKVAFDHDFVVIKDSAVELDFSAIAKGYGVDIVSDFLKEKGYQNFMVEIGGEIYCSGLNSDERPWQIGIDDPQGDRSNPYTIIGLENLAIATSGNYRNFYMLEGKKISHTIDPKTGMPSANDLLSASVLSDKCYEADAMATAFMVMGKDSALSFADEKNIMAAFIFSDSLGKDQLMLSKAWKARP